VVKMCVKRFKELLKTPGVAIKKAKKERDIGKTINVLIATWILCGFSFFIVAVKEGISLLTGMGISVSIFLFGVLLTMVAGYFIHLIMNVLGGRGKYAQGLTSITYSFFPLSFGSLITAFLFLIHPVLGVIVGFIIMGAYAALGLSILYKSVKELFSVDIITAWIGISLLILAFVLTIYTIMIYSPGVLANIIARYNFPTSI